MMYLWVTLGSALGGLARYWVSGLVASHYGETFPWGTIVVNVTGCFVIGFFATLSGPDGRLLAPSTVRQLVMTGICGGYTTFSSFSLQTLNLARDGQWREVWQNILGSTVSCLAATWLGFAAVLALSSMEGQ